jgi:hypothetical protein
MKACYDCRNKDVRDPEDLRDLAIECDGFRLSVGMVSRVPEWIRLRTTNSTTCSRRKSLRDARSSESLREEQQKPKP